MANRFSTNFRTEAQTGKDPIAVLDIDIGDFDTYRYSDVAAASLTRGMYKPQIISWGTLTYAASDRSNRLQAPQLDVTISDVDNELSHLFTGPAARSAIGSDVTIWLTYPGLAFVDWFKLFTGKLSSRTYEDAHVWRLGLRLDDSALASKTGDIVVPKVRQGDFPTAPESGLGKEIPIFYGNNLWNYSFNGIKGGILCQPCSTNGDPNNGDKPYRYTLAVGHIRGVGYIFTEAPSATLGGFEGTEWFWTERGGKYFTEVGFDADQTSNEPVYATGVGLSTSGEGTETPATEIVNPAEIIEHLLTNFVFNKWEKGDWYTSGTNSPLDTASISALADFFDDGYATSQVSLYTEGGSALSILNRWCQDWFSACWWNPDGDLQFGLRNPYDSDIYLDNNTPANWPWFKADEHGRGARPIYPLAEDDSKVVNRLTYDLGFVPKDNKYLGTSYGADPERAPVVEEKHSQLVGDFIGDVQGPVDVMTRRIRRDRFPTRKLSISSNVIMLDPDLFDGVLISDPSAPIPEASGTYDVISTSNKEGWGGHDITKARLYSLTGTTINLNTPMSVSCVLEDDRLFRCTFYDSGVGEARAHLYYDYTSYYGGFLFGTASDTTNTNTVAGYAVQAPGKQSLIYAGAPRREEDGILLTPKSTNYVINSCFNNGLTGWTITRATTVLSTVDPGVKLFTDSIEPSLSTAATNQTMKLGTTTTSAADSNVWRITTSFAANSDLAFSFWHKDSDATPAHYSLARNYDSTWLQSNGTSWGGSQYKFLTSSANGVWKRSERLFSVGSNATTITVLVGSPSGADDYTHIGQIQLEPEDSSVGHINSYVHGDIPTYDTIKTVTDDDGYYITNSSSTGYAFEYWKQGTARCIWKAPLNTADMDTSRSDFFLVDNTAHSVAYAYLAYFVTSGASGTFQFGNNTYTADVSLSVVKGQDYYVVARWDGTNKEFGESSNYLMLDVYDVTADTWYNDSSTYTRAVSPTDGFLYVGSSEAWGFANSYLRAIEVLPVVLSNQEILAYP